MIAVVGWAAWTVFSGLVITTSRTETLGVIRLSLITMLRVTVLIVIASIVWVPIGIKIGLNPRVTRMVQPVAQFMAAFPANLLFPIAFFGIVTWNLNADVGSAR